MNRRKVAALVSLARALAAARGIPPAEDLFWVPGFWATNFWVDDFWVET